MGLDIGPESVKRFTALLSNAKTVFWNGPMGVFEFPAYAAGTKGVAEAVIGATAKGAFSVVGGGDSAAAVRQLGLPEDGFSHISTGGGASLEYLEGKTLPGISILENPDRVPTSQSRTERHPVSRKPLIAGNWKMNLNHFEAIALVQKIAFSLPEKYFDKVDVTVIPPFTDLRSVQTLVDGDKLRLTYGAQDVSKHDSGAYTGEISGAFLAKLGCTFAVVGHSERRTYHGEDDALVAAKAAAALKHGLTPIVCIGEGLEIREAGDHVAYNVNQLKGSLAGLSAEQIGARRHRLRAGMGDRHRPGGQRRRRAGGLRRDPRRTRASWPRPPSPTRSGCSTAARSTPRTSGRSSGRPTSTAPWSAARRWTASSSPSSPRSPPADPCPDPEALIRARRPVFWRP